MTLPTEWISPVALRLLGLSLLHFLWQGAALAALAYVALAFCRNASTRYAIAVAILLAMSVAPLATFLSFRAQEATPASRLPGVDASAAASRSVFAAPKATPPAPSQSSAPPLYLLWLVEAWFAGVVFFSLRSVGGFFVVQQLRRRESSTVSEELLELCLELQDRMGISHVVRYCQSIHLDAPVVAGWLRPVVLLPVSAVTGLSSAQLEAVVAHELAHIRRYDAWVNLFQVAVESLLFYHPAVWWLGKRIRAEREHCCDDSAVAVCGSPVVYARALARLAELKPAPQLAMALNGSPLVDRITRLLGSPRSSVTTRAANLSAGVLCLSLALLAGSAFIGSVRKVQAQSPAPAPAPAPSPARVVGRPTPAPAPRAVDDAIIVRPIDPADAPAAPGYPATAPALVSATPAPRALAAPVVVTSPAPHAQGDPQQPQQSYIDSLKDAGLTNLSVDELISLKIQGVTGDYVKQMREAGMKTDPDDLIALKIQDVTPDYIRQMRAATGESLDADAIIGMKIQGVSTEYVKEMHDLGIKTNADDLIGMKIQGVTPEYVKEIRALGLKADADDLVAMKIQGVTPAYAKSFNELGYHPSTDELVSMKIQGVTPAYIKELQSAGFKFDLDDAIGAKIQGVTPEFIAAARSHGFKDLTLDKLIALKQSGVLDAEK